MGGRGDAAALEEEAIVVARESGDPAAIADALLAWLSGTNPMATTSRRADWHSAADEALTIATDIKDWGRLGRIQGTLAMIEAPLDPAAAERWLEQATEAARRSGNPQEIATAIQVRGRVASRTGRLVDAQRWFRESRAQFEAIGDQRFALSAQSELAHALRRSGAIGEAEAEYRQTIRGWLQSGNRGAIANQLESFASLAVSRATGLRAARLFGAAEALREAAGAPMTALEREEYDAEVGRLRGMLDAEAFASAWADGRRMTADEAVDFALSE